MYSIIAVTEVDVLMKKDNHSTEEKLIILVTNNARKKMNVNLGLLVFMNDGSVFKSVNHSGLFEKDNFINRYNCDWIKTATNERIINTAFHETFHAVRQQAEVFAAYFF